MDQLDISPADDVETLMITTSEIISDADSYFIPPKQMRQIYRLFCKWRMITRSKGTSWDPRMYVFGRNVTHFLVERCYWMRYGDNDMVCDLLRQLFAVDGHLGKIFDFQQLSVTSRLKTFNPNAELKTKTTWSDGNLQDEEVKPIDYFMDHAYKSKLLFNGKRFAEQYLVQCVYQLPRNITAILLLPPCARTFKDPDLLLKLLQHGIFVSGGSSSCQTKDVSKLLTGVIGSIMSVTCPLQANGYFDGLWSEYSYRIVESGNILLRAVDRVDVKPLFGVRKRRLRSVCAEKLIEHLSARHLLPKLKTRCYATQELQHLCRCVIRKRLYAAWQLPRGIFQLGAPRFVERYLNLEHD